MSDKIGILTIHSVFNYGAMLQAYALSTYLIEKDYKAEVINYQPYCINSAYKFYYRDLILRPRKALFHLKTYLTMSDKFTRFIDFEKKDIHSSKEKYITKKSLKNSAYSLFITGSDQIWNPFITGYDSSFFLDFVSSKIPKIAYSSSFGVSDIPEVWKEDVSKYLNEFKYLGLREKTGIDIVKSLFPEKNIALVLDPVFLLSRSHWESLSCDELTPDYDYLLVYSLEVNSEMISQAKTLSASYNLRIVTLHPYKDDYEFSDLSINNAGPKEFISLIRNAKYIVTNSFHGTAFSILFEKDFVCANHSKTGSRMSNLISLIDVNKDVLKDVEIYKASERSKSNVDKLVKESRRFLEKSVESCLSSSS